MIKGQNINLRLVQNEAECQMLVEAYNDLTQRADTDHTEITAAHALRQHFLESGLWTDTSGKLVIVDQEDRILGDIIFTKQSEFELEIGYRLYFQAARRKGYMREALGLFSAYLFETKPIQRLRIQTASDNIASRKLAEKCGYKQEGILRKAYYYRGHFCDFVIYGLLREECPPFSGFLTD